MLSDLIAHELAAILYCALYLLVYRRRLYYLGFAAICAIVGGYLLLEYVPALWWAVELIWDLSGLFPNRLRSKVRP